MTAPDPEVSSPDILCCSASVSGAAAIAPPSLAGMRDYDDWDGHLEYLPPTWQILLRAASQGAA